MGLRPLSDPLAAPLHRLVAPIAIVTALLWASPAMAAGLAPKLYGGQMKLGSVTASRSTNGACSISQVLTDLVLRCDGKGTAQVKYLFTLPSKAGSVTAQVNFDGTHRGAKVSTKRVADCQFRVTVTQDGQGRADIQSVMIEYYYPA
jgi:hypothetical protein